MSLLGLLIFCLGMAHLSLAQNLAPPLVLESSQTLPQAVRNPRFLNVWVSLDTRLNADGRMEPLGNKLNKWISWEDVLESQDDEIQRKVIRSVLNDNGIALESSPGSATGVANITSQVQVPVFAIGISPSWTVAIAVPIVKVDVSVDTGFNQSTGGQKFIDAACKTSPEKCNEAARKLNNATQQKLSRLGYEPLQSHSVSGLGDIQVQAKHQLTGDSEGGLTSKLMLTLPTGTQSNPDRALDITTGDNRFKVGAMFVYDQFIWRDRARWDVFGGYTALLPASSEKRLPKSDSDSLSKDKETVTKKLGSQFIIGTSIDYPIQAAGLSLGSGYSLQYLSKTNYDGKAEDENTQRRYALLSDLEPSQTLHSLLLSLRFSTVEWYRSKRFLFPMQLGVVYAQALAGRDVPRSQVVSGELVLFF